MVGLALHSVRQRSIPDITVAKVEKPPLVSAFYPYLLVKMPFL